MGTSSDAGERAERRERLALLGIVLLGAILRLLWLGHFSFWYDEGATLFLTRYIDLAGSFLFHPENTTEPPLNALFTWLWLHVVGLTGAQPTGAHTAFLIRLLPCLWGVLGVPMIYVLARAILRDGRGALIAAFLFAISPFEILYAQELRIYSFYVLVAMAALWCMVRALQDNKPAHWAGMALLMAVMPYAHFTSVWTIFTFNVCYVLVLWPYRRLFWRWFFANLAMTILIAPALVMAQGMNKMALEVEFNWYAPLTWKTGLLTFKDFFAGYGPTAWAYWPLTILAAALLALGVVSLGLRGRWAMGVLIAAQVVVPIVANIAFWKSRHFSFYEHRLFIVSGAVALIGIAAGVRALRPRAIGMAALGAFTLLTLPGLRDYYTAQVHPVEQHRIGIWDKVDLRAAVEYIESRWQEGDVIAYASHFVEYPLKFYTKKPHVRVCDNDIGPVTHIKATGNAPLLGNHDLLPARMDRATKNAKRVWFLDTFGTTFEYKPHTVPVRKALNSLWKTAEEKKFYGLSATLYERPDMARSAWPPNVLFILMDTTRADRVHAKRNGQAVMPFLDQFSKDGVDFDRAWSPTTWTRPAMASLMTGLYPECHGVMFSAELDDPAHPMTTPLPQSLTTMAEWLHGHGYTAFGVQTNANCTPELGFAQGFDAGYVFGNGPKADWVVNQVLEKLPALAPPYLLYAHFMDPHETYDPMPKYREAFGPLPDLPELDRVQITANFKRQYKKYVNVALGIPVDPADKNLPPLSDKARETMLMLYDAECRAMDSQIERLVNEATKRDPETIVIVTADHGEEFWEHGGMGHGTNLYSFEQRVPLLVRAQGLKPGVNSTVVNTLGLLPTLANLLHFAPEAAWQGMDWFGPAPEAVFGITKGSLASQQIDLASVAQDNYHYIRDAYCAREHLYDIAADPNEQNNLAAAQPERVARMRATLDAHLAANAQCVKGNKAKPAIKLNEGMREDLDTLGYLNGAPKPAAAKPAAPASAPAVSPTPIAADPGLMEQLRGMGYLNGAPGKETPVQSQRVCP